jgi:uncharacterized membrane protein YGL010W
MQYVVFAGLLVGCFFCFALVEKWCYSTLVQRIGRRLAGWHMQIKGHMSAHEAPALLPVLFQMIFSVDVR